MKNKLNLIITVIITMVTIFYAINIEMNFSNYIRSIFPILWIINFAVAIFLTINESVRIRARKDRISNIFLITTTILIIYFLSGLLFGYAYSPYSNKLTSILTNFYFLVLPSLLQLYVFTTIIHFSKKQRFIYFLTFLLLFLSNPNVFLYFIQSSTKVSYFENFFSIIVPIIIQTITILYLITTSGFLSALTYNFLLRIIIIVLPIFPNFNWFFLTIKHLLISVLIFFSIDSIQIKKVLRFRKKETKKVGTVSTVITIGVVLFMILFVTGILGFYPTAILSNSMSPEFSRGSVVIVKEVSSDLREIEVGDIIKYRYKNSRVIHRVIEKKEVNGIIYFQTQGDANNAPDVNLVSQEQVEGIVVKSLPYLGYPTVWLSEFLNQGNTNIDIELG